VNIACGNLPGEIFVMDVSLRTLHRMDGDVSVAATGIAAGEEERQPAFCPAQARPEPLAHTT
jgi:hypothetical protein